MAQVTHVFTMAMTCEGCSGAAERVLKKHSENSDITTDLETKKVTVTSTLSADELLEILKKTGKEVSYDGPK
ncbi:copper transport protein ATOX1-like [Haliotis cracherodii]|uniref:copper transport protein ATOX1-like n=1 Tax=Haliotis rufescens TaxID=6454 RepID=UPI00201E9762|nr:copper transport protein ATOX1-like [Haliotis rufescens]